MASPKPKGSWRSVVQLDSHMEQWNMDSHMESNSITREERDLGWAVTVRAIGAPLSLSLGAP